MNFDLFCLVSLYIKLLNDIAQNSLCKLRILLFFIICGLIMSVKITRILLYFFKTNTLLIRINATQNDLNNKRILLQNELQYRYILNFIIISGYILNIIFLESITSRWSIVIGCIAYFVMHICSVSLAQSYAAQIDDIRFCNFLHFSRVIFIGLIILIYPSRLSLKESLGIPLKNAKSLGSP
jgi:hypothetical protein